MRMMTNPWTTFTTTSTSSSNIVFSPAKPIKKVVTPLDWLREQVDEICALARLS